MLLTKFRLIWQSGFRGDDFLEINQSETRIICGGHVCLRIRTKWAIFIEDLPSMLPTKFRFIWPCSFRGEDSESMNKLCINNPRKLRSTNLSSVTVVAFLCMFKPILDFDSIQRAQNTLRKLECSCMPSSLSVIDNLSWKSQLLRQAAPHI